MSDIHISVKPPLARSDEENWFSAMERPWVEIHKMLAVKNPPVVLCAGDIFDKWNAPPELINWALERLPNLFGIPGNHDLPNHRAELSHRSAYGTLVRAGKIIELDSRPKRLYNLDVYGRPFGEDVPIPEDNRGRIKVLVTHEYLWDTGAGHIGAPEERKVSKVAREFRDFDVVSSGDNHVGFERRLKSGTFVFNCGGFMRRKSNEFGYKPRVGLLMADGSIHAHHLDTGKDVLIRSVTPEDEEVEDLENSADIGSFIEDLTSLEASDLSFREHILRAMDAKKVSRGVREAILEAMDSK